MNPKDFETNEAVDRRLSYVGWTKDPIPRRVAVLEFDRKAWLWRMDIQGSPTTWISDTSRMGTILEDWRNGWTIIRVACIGVDCLADHGKELMKQYKDLSHGYCRQCAQKMKAYFQAQVEAFNLSHPGAKEEAGR